MNKISTELYELLSEPKTFDTTIEFIQSVEEFKRQIATEFWDKVFDAIQKAERMKNFDVSRSDDMLEKYSKISITHKLDDLGVMYFAIQNEITQICYGVVICRDSALEIGFETIFQEAKQFQYDGWKFGNPKNSWWPLWYPLKEFNFSSSGTYKQLLPHIVNDTIEELVSSICEDFTSEIEEFINTHLKKLGIL